jgi:GDP-mannose 6-dehydrogenase
MRVSVFGLGYVGCVTAAALARQGHKVVGVDVNPDKVGLIAAGQCPIVEPDLPPLIAETVAAGSLRATASVADAVRHSEISLICVGTPGKPNGSLNLEHVFRVAEMIGRELAGVEHYHVVVLRSTVLPGTLDKVSDILASGSGKLPGSDFGVCNNPEFLREGTALVDYFKPAYTTVSTAETMKYCSNAFHALKVAFANEIGALCKTQGVDSRAVMDLLTRDRKLNISPAYLRPGFAFGGSCLPKDLRALAYLAKATDVATPLISAILTSNQEHMRRAIDLVLESGKHRVGILGLSFKANTDDLRESPMVALVEALIGKGIDVRVFDPNVQLARLIGANKSFIQEKLPHISQLIAEDASQLLDHAELLVLGTDAPEYREVVRRARPDQAIIDLVGGTRAEPRGSLPAAVTDLCG